MYYSCVSPGCRSRGSSHLSDRKFLSNTVLCHTRAGFKTFTKHAQLVTRCVSSVSVQKPTRCALSRQFQPPARSTSNLGSRSRLWRPRVHADYLYTITTPIHRGHLTKYHTKPSRSDAEDIQHTNASICVNEGEAVLLKPRSAGDSVYADDLDDADDQSTSDRIDIVLNATSHESKLLPGSDISKNDGAIFFESFFRHTSTDIPKTDAQTVGNRFSRKIDLSYRNVSDPGVSRVQGSTLYSMENNFRDSSGTRKILSLFMRHVQPHIDAVPSVFDEPDAEVESKLLEVFPTFVLTFLGERGIEVEDVLSWSWILSPGDVSVRIRRYIALSQNLRIHGTSFVPSFVPLQILRADSIDSTSLRMLLDEIDLTSRSQDRSSIWNEVSAPVLVIRLLRHARMTDVRLFVLIIELTTRLVPRQQDLESTEATTTHVRRLTHFYNRILTLTGLPIPRQPFLSMVAQQEAQLSITRFMLEISPVLPVNREGYRAFVRLQLMHKKTAQERDWAQAKGPSWPPWRRDQLGIHATVDYPGRRSRVLKVLQRMQEAGYNLSEWEEAAQILSGWDTDMSPTFQTRHILPRSPMPWLRRFLTGKGQTTVPVDKVVWVARVEATRSLREAWLAFYSYLEVTSAENRDMIVYQAMFNKLLAGAHSDNGISETLPGDSKEVFPDPISPRDLVYVPREPPSLDELYAQMRGDNIRPTGRLLTSLLQGSRSLDQGFAYIQDSRMHEVKRDVLLHAEKYPPEFIQSTLNTLPDHLLAGYISVLARRHDGEEVMCLWPGSRSSDSNVRHSKENVNSLVYGLRMLELSRTRYFPAYYAVLEGLRSHFVYKRRNEQSGNSVTFLWRKTKQVLRMMAQQGLHSDMKTFCIVAQIAQHVAMKAPSMFRTADSPISGAMYIARSLFTIALTGKKNFGLSHLSDLAKDAYAEIPAPRALEIMFRILGVMGRRSDIISLLHWMHTQQNLFEWDPRKGHRVTNMMCAARVALDVPTGNHDETEDESSGREIKIDENLALAQKYSRSLGWPTDAEIDEYVFQRRALYERLSPATIPLGESGDIDHDRGRFDIE